jgi:hypothetical protein
MSAQRSLWDINLDEVNQFLDAVTMTAQRIPPQPQQPPLPSAPPRQSAEKVQQHMRPSLRFSAAVSLRSRQPGRYLGITIAAETEGSREPRRCSLPEEVLYSTSFFIQVLLIAHASVDEG